MPIQIDEETGVKIGRKVGVGVGSSRFHRKSGVGMGFAMITVLA
jgi:hypothetical protein